MFKLAPLILYEIIYFSRHNSGRIAQVYDAVHEYLAEYPA